MMEQHLPQDGFDKTITPENYDFLCKTVKEISGLFLDANKAYLVETRLQSVAKDFGFNSLNRLIEGLRGPMSLKLRTEIAEAMATPETFFFRDKKPFDQMKDVLLPEIIKRQSITKKISIWCAASSSGQEPYSLAMLCDDLSNTILSGYTVRIVASDFSNKILQKCNEGVYTQFEVQRGLPISYLMKYFQQKDSNWVVKDEIKRKIEFRNHNLLHSAAALGMFDIVFCRNVLFYFDQPSKIKILEDIARVTNPGGYLFLGSAETVIGITNKFTQPEEHRGFYVKADGAKPAAAPAGSPADAGGSAATATAAATPSAPTVGAGLSTPMPSSASSTAGSTPSSAAAS